MIQTQTSQDQLASPLDLQNIAAEILQADLLEALRQARNALLEETRALRAHAVDRYAECHRRKDECLLDLTRRSRKVVGLKPTQDIIEALAALRKAIEENQTVLQTHLAAARRIADVVMQATQDADSDRTYSTNRKSWMRRA